MIRWRGSPPGLAGASPLIRLPAILRGSAGGRRAAAVLDPPAGPDGPSGLGHAVAWVPTPPGATVGTRSRRGFLGTVGATGLLAGSGCGFQPLYGPVMTSDGAQADIAAELAAVRVAPMFERFGQVMRRELQRRLEGAGPGTAARYTLDVAVGLRPEVLGFRRDGTISRVRYTASGSWTLATQTVPPEVIARTALPYRTIDAFNVPDLQFFSADAAREAAEQRLIVALSDEIVREVALALRQRLAERPGGVGAAAPVLPPA